MAVAKPGKRINFKLQSTLGRSGVLVRELLHLPYRNHDKRFQPTMSACVPGWHETERQRRQATQPWQELRPKRGLP